MIDISYQLQWECADLSEESAVESLGQPTAEHMFLLHLTYFVFYDDDLDECIYLTVLLKKTVQSYCEMCLEIIHNKKKTGWMSKRHQ